MKSNDTNQPLQKPAVRMVLVTLCLLLVPLLGRFPWGGADYLVMGLLIFGVGMLLDWAARAVDKKYRLLVIAVILGGAFLLWAELSVDLISQLLDGSLWIYSINK